MLRALQGWNFDLHATDNWNQNAAHFAAAQGSFIVLRDLKDWGVDLSAEDDDGETPMFNAIVRKQDLPTAQHLVLLGAQVRPEDFPATHIEIRQQLMAWADDHLTRHRVFVSTVLPAIHDDGSHTAENQTNWLAHLAGLGEFRRCVAEYLGIRDGAEHRALANAMAVWRPMPPVPAGPGTGIGGGAAQPADESSDEPGPAESSDESDNELEFDP